jgi:uncharacterized protein with HEPN domain
MRTSRLLLQDMLDAIAVIRQYTPVTERAFTPIRPSNLT